MRGPLLQSAMPWVVETASRLSPRSTGADWDQLGLLAHLYRGVEIGRFLSTHFSKVGITVIKFQQKCPVAS